MSNSNEKPLPPPPQKRKKRKPNKEKDSDEIRFRKQKHIWLFDKFNLRNNLLLQNSSNSDRYVLGIESTIGNL